MDFVSQYGHVMQNQVMQHHGIRLLSTTLGLVITVLQLSVFGLRIPLCVYGLWTVVLCFGLVTFGLLTLDFRLSTSDFGFQTFDF